MLIDTTFDREDIEKNLPDLDTEHLTALRLLLNKEIRVADVRSVTDTLRTVFKELYGIKIINHSKGRLEVNEERGGHSRQKQLDLGLKYADDFSSLLYTCGLL